MKEDQQHSLGQSIDVPLLLRNLLTNHRKFLACAFDILEKGTYAS